MELENFESGPVVQSAYNNFKNATFVMFILQHFLGALGYVVSHHSWDCRAGLSFA